MILQSLVDYYEQLLKSDPDGVARPGWCPRNISFMLDISPDGKLENIFPAEEKHGWARMVPEQAKRTVGIEPNLLCDNASYFLGVDTKGKPERSTQCFEAAKDRHLAFLANIESDASIAIKRFFETWDPRQAFDHPRIIEAGESLLVGGNLVFRVNKQEVLNDQLISRAWDKMYKTRSQNGSTMTCLVSGENVPIARLHPTIKGVVGSQSMGASLVGFNARSFESYGRDEEQGLNAPVGEYAAFAYATALNYLLADKKHRIRLGDTTVVFWSDSHDEECSCMFSQAMTSSSFDDEPVNQDETLEAIMKKHASGMLSQEVDLDANFFVLGLAPNAARISVRFFHRDTFGAMLDNVRKHYNRISVTHAPFEKEYLCPYQLLAETANVNAKEPAATSVLSGALMRSILQDNPYPAALFSNTILRIQASQNNSEKHIRKISRGRAAIIKACLIKNYQQSEEAVTVALNKERDDIPYVLGRLFAVLESVQEAASPGINTTINDKYFNSASSTPSVIFPLLSQLEQKHMKKVLRENPGLAVHFQKQIADLYDRIPDFPRRLSLEDRGAFILGYYHQMQDRYTKKNNEQEV